MCSDLRYFNFYMIRIKCSLFGYFHIDLWNVRWFYNRFTDLIAYICIYLLIIWSFWKPSTRDGATILFPKVSRKLTFSLIWIFRTFFVFWLFRSRVRFFPESVRRSFAGIWIVDNYPVCLDKRETRYFDYYITFYWNTCKWDPQTIHWVKMPGFDDYLKNRYWLVPALLI